MDKIKPLAALVLAACSTGVSADVALNAHGLGQGLLFPYYTVEDGKTTAFAIHNTTAVGKALKVRIMESYAGRDVLLSTSTWRPMQRGRRRRRRLTFPAARCSSTREPAPCRWAV